MRLHIPQFRLSIITDKAQFEFINFIEVGVQQIHTYLLKLQCSMLLILQNI